jgi:hypothetical protein
MLNSCGWKAPLCTLYILYAHLVALCDHEKLWQMTSLQDKKAISCKAAAECDRQQLPVGSFK